MIYFLISGFLAWRFCRLIAKYSNPYKLIIIFGKKGSGKTTLATKLAVKYQRKGIPVYANFFVPGTYEFHPDKLGVTDIDPDSVIMLDEAGMIWNSRDYKTFSGELRNYFKLQRHFRHTVILLSQQFDVDKTIRVLADYMYVVEGKFNFLSVAKKVTNRLTVLSAAESSTNEAKIVDDFVVAPAWTWPFGGRIVTFIPHWIKYFNSFDIEPFGKELDKIYRPPLYEMTLNRRQYVRWRAGEAAQAFRRALRLPRIRRIKDKNSLNEGRSNHEEKQ